MDNRLAKIDGKNKVESAIASEWNGLKWVIRSNLREAFRWFSDHILERGVYRVTRPIRDFGRKLFFSIAGKAPETTPTTTRQQAWVLTSTQLKNYTYETPTTTIRFFEVIREFIDRMLTIAPSDYFPSFVRFMLAFLLIPAQILFLVLKIPFFFAYIPYEKIGASAVYAFKKLIHLPLITIVLTVGQGGTHFFNTIVYLLRCLAALVVSIPFALFMINYRKLGSVIRPYLYIAPAMIVLVIFTFYPILNTVYMSFLEGYSYMAGTATGLGLQNYINVLRDPIFYQALKNTLFIAFISVPISVVIALLISVALNSIKFFQGIIQTVFFLPYVTNVIAIGLVFTVLFYSKVDLASGNPYGVINYILGFFGVEPLKWVAIGTNYTNAAIVLVSYTVWSALAFKIMVFLSGIQGIDKQYYQAAKVDATPGWRVLLRITVPMLSPMIAYVTITSFIGGFKSYAAVVALFGDSYGPVGQSNLMITVVGYIFNSWNNLGTPGELSKAAAGSVILLVIILFFTAFELHISKKRVHY